MTLYPNICLCGLTASGKTYLSKIAKDIVTGEYLIIADLLLDLGIEKGFTSLTKEERTGHFWKLPKAQIFNNERLKNSDLDILMDAKIKNYLDNSCSLVVDALSSPIVQKNRSLSFNILLDIDIETRTRRAMQKEGTNFDFYEAKKYIKQKDEIIRNIIKRSYSVDILTNEYHKFFDLIIDNSIYEDKYNILTNKEFCESLNKNIMQYSIQMYLDALGFKRDTENSKIKFQGLYKEYKKVFKKIPDIFLNDNVHFSLKSWKQRGFITN